MFNSAPYAEPVIGRRFGETMIELMHQAKWTPWWTVQPEMQYIISPGVLNSGDGLQPNALVIALRSTISF
jgi:porin